MRNPIRGGADIETGALVLIGDEAALRELSALLRHHHSGAVPLEPIRGRPALRPIQLLTLGLAEHVATITISGDAAVLSGSAASLDNLADEIEGFWQHNDLTEPGAHTHIDAAGMFGEASALSDRSVDLILAGSVPDKEL